MTTNKVYQAINKVQKALSETGISKDRRNQQQGYQFRGIDDVYNALSPLLAENGLCILPRMLSRKCEERQSSKGGVLFYVTVEAEFDFVSAEDGSKCVVRTYGEAMDSGDKATNKAMSAAYKYAAFQTFAIPTEGNPDADSETHTVTPKASEEPKSRLNMDDAIVALRESDSLESLQSVFGTVYKAANAQQKAELKSIYDKRKAELESSLETA